MHVERNSQFSRSMSLDELRADLNRCMGDYRRLSEQLMHCANALLEQTNSGARNRDVNSDPNDEPPRATEATGTRPESTIAVNNACQLYVQYLTSLDEIVDHAEKLVRTSRHSLKLERRRSHLDSVSRAVDATIRCVQYINALSELENTCEEAETASCSVDPGSTSVVVLLRTLSEAVVPRVRDAAKGCRSVLSATMQSLLQECSWPPPLLPSSSSSSSAAAWQGFADAGDEIFGELQEVIVQMLALQMATEHAMFCHLSEETAGDVELWPAMEFASAVNTWISSHFAPNMPTCKIERPEWLFSAVSHAVKSCSEHVDVFEACIEAQGIQQYFSMPVEVAKSVYRRGLLAVVKGVYIPLLFEERDASYALHFVDEASKFEDKFLPLRTDPAVQVGVGAASGSGTGTDADPGTFRRNGCMILDLLFVEESWCSEWLQFEEEEARQRIWNDYSIGNVHRDDGISTQDAVGDINEVISHSFTNNDDPDVEFRPSTSVRNAMETLTDLLARTTYMSVPDNRVKWCHKVVSTAFETLKSHLRSEMSRVEQFDHLTDTIGAPTVASCLNDLRWLEHALLEPSGALMEVIVVANEREDDERGVNGPLWSFLEREAAALSTLRRKWTNVVVEEVAQAVVLSFLQEGDDASLHILRLLDDYSKWLDQVGFRELWVGMARAADRVWATEGGAESEVGLERLIGAFAGCTNNPRAYFRLSLSGNA